MEHIRNGDFKVSYEQERFGRRRNDTIPACRDLTSEAINAAPARVQLPPKRSTSSRRRTYADGELDVFSAERYFKGATDYDHKEGSAAPVETVVARPAVPLTKPAWTCASAVSAGSGASANSQTVLLRDARRSLGYRGINCCLQVGELLRPCSGKKAVRIDDGGVAKEVAEPSKTAASRIEWYRDLRMEKANLGGLGGEGNRGVVASGSIHPNLSLGAAKVAAIGREEKAAQYVSASFRRGSFTVQAPVKVSGGRGGGRDDDHDSGSESSSDLFEIKSLVIDDSPYEPSEASIQWSVVTASAVDMSERGGGRAGSQGSGRGKAQVTTRQNRERQVGLLTGCVSRRAVNVSDISDVRRFSDSSVRRRIDG